MLTGDEGHHCRDVMRHNVGDTLIVFNGQGAEATVSVKSVKKQCVQLETMNVTKAANLYATLTLAQSVIKGKKMDLILQKATELGVSRIVPLLTERSVVKLSGREIEKRQEKWSRTVIEACKQSGQNWLPVVEKPQTMEQFLNQAPAEQLNLLASLHSEARTLPSILSEYQEGNEGARPSSAMVMIGPEGDFTPSEMAAAKQQGCLPWSLGSIVMRSETAALYTLSVLGYELGL